MAKTKHLLPTSKAASEEWDQVLAAIDGCHRFVRLARYKKSFDLAKKTYKTYPRNRFALYLYAVSLGDSREFVSEAQYQKNQKEAAQLLRQLLRRGKGINPRHLFTIKNEYYWFSKQPYKQFRLGIESVKKIGPRAFYSAGVGAVSLSINCYRAKKQQQAKRWAEKAIYAWQRQLKVNKGYYNPYVWYARALGLSGDLRGMEKNLRIAAKLSKRPISYQEFVRARDTVLEAIGNK